MDSNALEIPSLFSSNSSMTLPAGQIGAGQLQGGFRDPTQNDLMRRGTMRGGVRLPDLMRAIIAQESSNNPNARGQKGERGLMQIMPETAAQYGVSADRLNDPATNLMVGQRYLSDLWKRFGGDPNSVLAAYNAGPTRVAQGRIPSSTKKYISDIWNRLGNLSMGGTAEAAELPGDMKGAKEVDNPWSKSPVPGATEVANPWGSKTAPEALYEKGRSAILPFVAGGLSDLDPRHSFMPIVNPKTGKMEAAPPSDFGKSAANAVVPPTLTGAGVQAGLMGTGIGEMGLLARLGLPAIGGALGAYAEGKPPSAGAAEGALSAVGGEVLGAVAGILGRVGLKNQVAKDTTRKVAESLGNTIGKRVGMQAPKDSEMFERVFSQGGIENRAGKIAEMTSREANQVLGRRKLNVGNLGPPMTLPEIEDTIEALNEGVYLPSGQMRSIQGRGPMIRAAYQLREATAAQLDVAGQAAGRPELGAQWRQARKDAAAARVLGDVFDPTAGIYTPEGQLDPIRGGQRIAAHWDRLNRTLGPQDTQKLLLAMRRGAKGPVSDVPGRELHGRIGMSLEPHFGFPRTYKPVGNVPPIMNKAATNPARIPAGIGIDDLQTWFNTPLGSQ